MDDNKKTTQVDVTPASTNGEDKTGGKTFTQEDVDKIIATRINEEKNKNQSAIADAVNTAIAEYERKAKLTQEEKDKEAKSKKDAELKQREEQITLRERKLEAQEMLIAQNIPTDLVDFIVDLDEAKTKENIEKLAKTYNKSVEDGVTGKLKGTPPIDFSNDNNVDKPKKVMSAF